MSPGAFMPCCVCSKHLIYVPGRDGWIMYLVQCILNFSLNKRYKNSFICMVVFYWIPVCIGLSSKNLLERGRLQREGTVLLFAGYVAACRMLETFRHVWDRPSCVFSNFWHWPVNENPPTQPWCVMTFAFAKLRVWISILCGVRFWGTAHPSLP